MPGFCRPMKMGLASFFRSSCKLAICVGVTYCICSRLHSFSFLTSQFRTSQLLISCYSRTGECLKKFSEFSQNQTRWSKEYLEDDRLEHGVLFLIKTESDFDGTKPNRKLLRAAAVVSAKSRQTVRHDTTGPPCVWTWPDELRCASWRSALLML